MQFTVLALSALAAVASANYSNATVVYTTEVHTAYTTVCPASTELTFNGVTYTATASTTLTITNCPCTVVKPVTTSSVVYCNTCYSSAAPVYPTANTTAPVYSTKTAVGTTSAYASSTAKPTQITTSGASKFAMSGASLAGVLGLAAYFL